MSGCGTGPAVDVGLTATRTVPYRAPESASAPRQAASTSRIVIDRRFQQAAGGCPSRQSLVELDLVLYIDLSYQVGARHVCGAVQSPRSTLSYKLSRRDASIARRPHGKILIRITACSTHTRYFARGVLMVQLNPSEMRLTEDVLACLGDAIEQSERIELAYANKTKIQKLLYLAIDEFDLPVTYSWYLAGSVVPDSTVSPATVAEVTPELPQPDQPSTSDISPGAQTDEQGPATSCRVNETRDVGADTTQSDSRPLDPVLFPDVPTNQSAADLPGALANHVANRQTVVEFFTRVIPDVWHQETMRFLQNFYNEHAPSQYRSLYVTSAHLRTHLLDAEDAVAATLRGETPARSLTDITQALRLDISDLHYYLKRDDDLATTLESVVEGTAVIEDAFLRLEQLDNDELTPAHRDALGDIQEFVYYTGWRHPCLIISRNTASGPQATQLREERNTALAQFETTAEQSRDDLSETLAAAGLLPDASDISLPEDKLSDSIATLTREYLDQ